MKALAGSISALKVKYADVELVLDAEPEHGLADSGDLDTDLADLLTATAEAAAERGAAVVLSVDELQYVPEDQLAALIRALHTANQARLPVTMLAAGSPQLLRAMRRAKSYAERPFEFVPIDRSNDAAAAHALQLPPGAKAWSSPTRRSASCSSRAGATPTSSSNGASRSETSPTPLRSVATRLDERSTKSWPISTQRLPSALRQTHPGREDLHARDGRAWARPSPLRRDRRPPRAQGHHRRADPKRPPAPGDREGHDLQSGPRGDGFHSAPFRQLHAADHGLAMTSGAPGMRRPAFASTLEGGSVTRSSPAEGSALLCQPAGGFQRDTVGSPALPWPSNSGSQGRRRTRSRAQLLEAVEQRLLVQSCERFGGTPTPDLGGSPTPLRGSPMTPAPISRMGAVRRPA